MSRSDGATMNGPPTDARSASKPRNFRYSAGLLAIGGFFLVKMVSGLAIITASANCLSVRDFADFTQFSLFLAYLTLVASGGVVNGVIRQVAAHDDLEERRRVLHAAISIWGVASLLSMTAGLAFASPLSELLTGSPRFATLIVALTACSVVAGLGQLLCAVLTGMKRVFLSLLYQAAGLLASIGACLYGLYQNDVAVAVLGFAAGPMVTTLLASGSLARLVFSKSRWLAVMQEARVQLGFAGAFLITASIPPMILFALRYIYRDAFGVAPIAYWLLANRVSDINTQIVGLYLAQIFLPTLTGTALLKQPRVVGHALALCVGVSISAFAIFAMVGEPLIRLVFHDQLVRSYRYILGYLFGDVLRAIVSVAMVCSLARGRPYTYALIEIISYALFAIMFAVLIMVGVVNAPFIAYPLAFAVTGVVAWTVFVPELRPVFRIRAADQGETGGSPKPS